MKTPAASTPVIDQFTPEQLAQYRELLPKVVSKSDHWLLDHIVHHIGGATPAQQTWINSLVKREGQPFKND